MGLPGNKLWKRDETAALIALYETERCLYDLQDEHFNNPVEQKEAYERIHKVMLRIRPSCTIGEIKFKINYLQRQYAGEVLHRNISVQAGLCSEKSYKSSMWCFGLLQFLDDYLPLMNTSKRDESVEEEENVPIEKVTSDPEITNDHMDASSSSEVTEGSILEDNAERKLKKKRKLDPPSSSQIVTENVPVQTSVDREDIFGQYVATEMRNLRDNPLLYLQTKQSILQILTSANFELINPE